MDRDKILKAQECLADNGIDPDETSVVIQALGYILLDVELEDLIDWEYGEHYGNKI